MGCVPVTCGAEEEGRASATWVGLVFGGGLGGGVAWQTTEAALTQLWRSKAALVQ